MAHLNPDNIFQSWEFSRQEELQAGVLSTPQKQLIQNEIALAAASKVALKFTPDNVMEFMQIEAELQGKINAYRFLLDRSQECEIALDPAMRKLNLDNPSGN